MIAAGRNPDRGPQDILLDSGIQKAQLDFASPNFPEALKRLSPEIVIHCAGPFQGQDYRVVSATISAGAHYIDLADSREFVVHFAEHNNTAARSADLLVVSGASSVPALSSAVVDHLAGRFERLQEIQIVIAPAQRASRGVGCPAQFGKFFAEFIEQAGEAVHRRLIGRAHIRVLTLGFYDQIDRTILQMQPSAVRKKCCLR